MEKALLVGLNTGEDKNFDSFMEELKALAEACEYEIVGTMVQNLAHPIAATYIGSGKVEEINAAKKWQEFEVCIFEDSLSPVQQKNLQNYTGVRVMDRTGLILEIFSKRARTREAKLQVESAQLSYMMPRLIGMWEAIGRQGGGSGSTSNKGVGETQLELDRRWIQRRLAQLRRELDVIEHDRDIQRRKREKGNIPLVALVGYTNAGKSTVMNHLLGLSKEADEEKKVLEKDMLFATLDTSVRRISTACGKDFLLSDTVGFIDKLPHTLVKAFRSTLDEIKYADLLLEVVDISDERYIEQMKVTQNTLKELGIDSIPIIHVMNKADKCMEEGSFPRINGDNIYMSASGGIGMDMLVDMIVKSVYADNRTVEMLIPYSMGGCVNDFNENALVYELEYRENGVYIKADAPQRLIGKYEKDGIFLSRPGDGAVRL